MINEAHLERPLVPAHEQADVQKPTNSDLYRTSSSFRQHQQLLLLGRLSKETVHTSCVKTHWDKTF